MAFCSILYCSIVSMEICIILDFIIVQIHSFFVLTHLEVKVRYMGRKRHFFLPLKLNVLE